MKKSKLLSIVCLIFVAMVISQICQAEVWDITKGIPFVFEEDYARESVLSQIDETHFLCVYRNQDANWNWLSKAVILTADIETGTVTKETTAEIYSNNGGVQPDIARIDDFHYLCVFEVSGGVGNIALVLSVDNSTWEITQGTPLVFATGFLMKPVLSEIDDTHFLCVYADVPNQNGTAIVLTVNMNDWSVSSEIPFEFEDADCTLTPAIIKVDDSHFLCTYTSDFGQGYNGYAVILTVDNSDWTIIRETQFEFYQGSMLRPALCQINSSQFLCAYEADNDTGESVVLSITDFNTWGIISGIPFVFDSRDNVGEPAIAKIDDSHYLCAYYVGETGFTGWSKVLVVDALTGTITSETPFEFDTDYGCEPALAQIDDSHYLCTYKGLNETATDDKTGWSVILNVELEQINTGTVEGQVIELAGMYPIPIEGAEIYNGTELIATSNETGHFTFEIEAGTYMFTCIAEGYEDLTEEVVVIAGEITSQAFIMTSTTVANDNIIPSGTVLNANFPNPFNPETTICFSNHKPGHVIVEIYNTKGQKVKTLVNEHLAASNHSVVWQGDDDTGKSVSSGIYFYKMNSGIYSSTKKMILMK
ncbi:MAG: T9SS type A sorting domain-containing protein [Candidatus Cloacimonetes bacterium]|nr:T9SS type A sorting domain-containing protein [Candidatus Cloacimonadota bacterium]